MQEESPGIRPVWLIGGSAVLVFVGLCALISLCAAVPIVWLTVQRSSNDARATQVAVQDHTEQAVTLVPATQNLPTALPAPSAQPTMPIQTAVVRTAPDQAVRTYYQWVSQQRYDLSWPLLTDAFKQKFNCCAPNYNYTDYVGWWDSVNYVDFGSVYVVSQNGDQAVVYAELYFVMNSGARSSVDSNPYIELLYDPTSGNWRFNDKRASP